MYIVVYLGSGKVNELKTEKREITVGRDPSCDLVLDEQTISRKHASIALEGESIIVRDLGSRNGTFVGGRRVDVSKIEPGQDIRIGTYRITVYRKEPPQSEVAAGDETSRTCVITSINASEVSVGADIEEGVVSQKALSQRLKAISDLGRRLCGQLTLRQIGEAFIDVVFDTFSKVDRAIVLLEDNQAGGLVPFCVKDRSGRGAPSGVSSTLVNTILRERQAVVCSDTTTDDRFKDARSLQDLRIRSTMCAPLLIGDKVIGMAEADSSGGGIAFSEDDLRVFTALSSQVSIAVENARLYEEVARSRRLAAIGQTISGVAHCVKNVLNGIEGGLFITGRAIETGEKERLTKGWDMLRRNTTFLKTLVLDMLDYSKSRKVEPQEVVFQDFLCELIDLNKARAEEAGIELILSADETISKVNIDPVRMKRALLNLVSNAIEATPQGGRVELHTARTPSGLVIEVKDTGTGIPEEMIEKIFEPFVSTKGTKGTGLGLPVTKKIVEEHGGTIDVESEKGEGTCFRITLPASP